MSTNEPLITIPLTFSCTIVNGKLIIPNLYHIQVHLEPVPPINEHAALTFQRINYFVNNCLQDSIIINSDHDLYTHLENYDNNIVILPCDPYDFYLGCILFAKISTIIDNHFSIGQIAIDSSIGDNVVYYINDSSDCGLNLNGDNWWNKNDISTNSKDSHSWENLQLVRSAGFQPKIIQGGLSGNR